MALSLSLSLSFSLFPVISLLSVQMKGPKDNTRKLKLKRQVSVFRVLAQAAHSIFTLFQTEFLLYFTLGMKIYQAVLKTYLHCVIYHSEDAFLPKLYNILR